MDRSTNTRRDAEAGASAECLPLAATAMTATSAPGLDPSDPFPPGATAVDARIKRTGDLDFLQGSVACMAAEPNLCFPPQEATRVVSDARRLRPEMPEDDLSVHDA